MKISDLIHKLELVAAQHGHDIQVIISTPEYEEPIKSIETFKSSAGTVVVEIVCEYD